MFILNERNSVASEYLAEMRDVKQQTDRLRFRKNLERLGEIMAYEISRHMPFREVQLSTPLAKTSVQLLAEQPVLIPVLRAGAPFHQGFSNIFDRADTGFIGACRAPHTTPGDVNILLDYVSIPETEGRHIILIDPMLASGKSMLKAVEAIMKQGEPAHLYLVSVIAAPEGVSYLKNHLKADFSLWTCALDQKLDEHSYIVPGLGDAGDLAFGSKI